MIRYLLYNIILTLIAPFGVLYLLCSSRYRPLLQRFVTPLTRSAIPTIWVHACSVGEVLVAAGMIRKLRLKYPAVPVVLSVGTLSGFTLAKTKMQDVTVALAPFDLYWSVRRFIKRARPALLVIAETELWPNMVRETRRHGAAVVMINGRISPKPYRTFKRFRSFLPPVFSLVSAVGVQDETYAERFRDLGVHADAVVIAGNMKYDSVTTEFPKESLEALRRENGFSDEDRILIFGSARIGDESLAASCWQVLKKEFPELKMIIAPRHTNDLKTAMAPFRNEDIQCRTKVITGNINPDARVLFLDTLGELPKFYAISTLAVIGGSFYPGVDGHNPLESAALGVPTIFGPYMDHFPVMTSLLVRSGGAAQVPSPDVLLPTLRQLLNDSKELEMMGMRGRRAVLNKRGAVERNLDIISRYFPQSS